MRAGLLLFALAWAMPGQAADSRIDHWSAEIAEASARFGIPEDWIRRVMRAESGGRTTLRGRPIESHAGAMGLMQLMPGTWREMRSEHGLGADPHDPRDNILAGTAYLRLMYDRFGYPGLFAAYNAGPARYAGHIATRRRLPAETVAYVAGIIRKDGAARTAARIREKAPPLFVLLAHPSTPDSIPEHGSVATAPRRKLFVDLEGLPQEKRTGSPVPPTPQ